MRLKNGIYTYKKIKCKKICPAKEPNSKKIITMKRPPNQRNNVF